uniref:Uncharacterized protein n=1 Tax=Solanum lycopersicum TaxID=4081 RepID=A0A3Q7H4G5_SOLLC
MRRKVTDPEMRLIAIILERFSSADEAMQVRTRFCADELFKHFVPVPTYDEDTRIIHKLCSNCYFSR